MDAVRIGRDREEEAVRDVLAAVQGKLGEAPPEWPRPGIVDRLFEQNAISIVRETIASLRAGYPLDPMDTELPGAEPAALAATGRVSAELNRHPAEGLLSAEVLFDAGLPVLFRILHADQEDAPSTVDIAQALHHAIWRRFPPGAVAYVEGLLERLAVAYEEGRKFVSRELHDRVAHGIVAGIQRLELSQLQRQTEDSNTNDAVEIFREVLADVQDLTVALRQLVGARHLTAAVQDFVSNLDPSSLAVNFSTAGTQIALPQVVAEEAFTIIQEAVRNARRHACDATELTVNIQWSSIDVAIAVSDNGPGFDAAAVRSSAVGLSSMRERAEAIRATFQVTTGNHGTTVFLRISFNEFDRMS